MGLQKGAGVLDVALVSLSLTMQDLEHLPSWPINLVLVLDNHVVITS